MTPKAAIIIASHLLFVPLSALVPSGHPLSADNPETQLPAVSPSGTSDLDGTDKPALSRSLLAQLKAAGISVTHPDFFPADSPQTAFDDANMSTQPSEITGAAPHGHDYNLILQAMENASFSQFGEEKACDSTVINQDFSAHEVFVALHETVHYVVISVPGALDRAFAMIPKTPYSKVTEQNIYERIADTGAALYILSNYDDDQQNANYLQEEIDRRQASIGDTVHYSASSLLSAITAYRENPRPHMTIVQAAMWATDIVSHQTTIDTEMRINNDALRLMQAGEQQIAGELNDKYKAYNPAAKFYTVNNYLFTLHQEIKTASEARNRLCIAQPTALIVAANN